MGRFATLLGFGMAACAGQAQNVPLAPADMVDPPSITQLEGYRIADLPESQFGGVAHWLEVGAVTAPPLLLIHGIGDGGARDFYDILPHLAQQFHVTAVDLPGFARSTHGSALYSPKAYVAFLHQTIVPNIPRPFTLMGHSMGGAIALLYAHHHPESVSRLVVIDAAGILHRDALVPFIAANGIGKLFEPAGSVVDLLTGVFVTRAPGPEALLANDTARAHLFSDPKQIAAAALIVHNFGPAIANTPTPTLILWGRNDAIAPIRTAKLLAARLPLVELSILEKSAHVPMETEPETLSSTVLQWARAPAPQANTDAYGAAPSQRVGRCDHARGVTFAGDYRQIDIVGCQAVLLSHVRAETLRIWDSEVAIEAGHFRNTTTAVTALRSRVEMTGCVVSGALALQLDASELDIAGSDFSGHSAAIRTNRPSRILFSASRTGNATAERYLHEVVELGENQAL